MAGPGFEIEPWEIFCDFEEQIRPHDGLCAFPDCRAPFRAVKAWQCYCCAECRRADQAEARRVGHMIARPVLIMRETKHAKPRTGGALLNSSARRYVDQVASRWREARTVRAREAEARTLMAPKLSTAAAGERP